MAQSYFIMNIGNGNFIVDEAKDKKGFLKALIGKLSTTKDEEFYGTFIWFVADHVTFPDVSLEDIDKIKYQKKVKKTLLAAIPDLLEYVDTFALGSIHTLSID
jgi:hypothetical protein